MSHRPILGKKCRSAGALLVATLLVSMAACAEDGKPKTDSARSKDSSAIEQAKDAGKADAERAGEPVEPPTGKTIGYMWLTKVGNSSQRLFADLKEAADKFGWKIVDCDPNFDPAKVAQCAQALVAQKPDAIISLAQPTALIADGMRLAKQHDIPWINTGAYQTPSPDLAAQYVPDEAAYTKMLDEWMIEQIHEQYGADADGTVVAFQAPAVGPGMTIRDEQRAKDLSAVGLKQVTHDIDFSDGQDTLKTTKLLVGQNPDTVAVWNTCDFCGAPMINALDQLGLEGKDRPISIAFYTSEETRQAILDGRMTGAIETNSGAQNYIAIDRLAEFWARGTPLAPSIEDAAYSIDVTKAWILDKSNVDDPKVHANLGTDYQTYFATKWGAEFGL